jgi:hypothetical protein
MPRSRRTRCLQACRQVQPATSLLPLSTLINHAPVERPTVGATYLDLYARNRPDGYFLPTQTAGWFFSLGGTIANSVHGGVFEGGYLQSCPSCNPLRDWLTWLAHARRLTHAYADAKSMQVMFANGTVATLEEEADLKMWRNSFGLLGIITAVEMQLVQRPLLDMQSMDVAISPEWTLENWQTAQNTTWADGRICMCAGGWYGLVERRRARSRRRCRVLL